MLNNVVREEVMKPVQEVKEMDLYVEVLPEDIQNGKKADSENCPIARAVRRDLEKLLPNARIKVNTDKVVVEDNGNSWKGSISEAVREFISGFDGGKLVERMGFKLILKK